LTNSGNARVTRLGGVCIFSAFAHLNFSGETEMRSRLLIALAALAGGACTSSALAVGTTYAIDLRASTTSNRLIVFPANAPALNVVSTTGTFRGFAMDFNASATTLFGITTNATLLPPFQIGTIDQTTGNFTTNANVTGAGAAETNWSGLASDTNGLWYASASGGAGINNLYTISPATGITTLVGNINAGSTALNIDITIDRNGQMFGMDIATDRVYKIDKTSGAVTFLSAGSMGFNANFAQGMDFDWDTNTLYATIYTGGGTGVYASIDTTTGVATQLISTTSWNAEMEMSVKAAIPEPAAVAIVSTSGTLLLRRRRRPAVTIAN
jgi:hypothetical protein